MNIRYRPTAIETRSHPILTTCSPNSLALLTSDESTSPGKYRYRPYRCHLLMTCHSFTGSAGTAVIPSSSQDADALLFVDSRYWIQAEKQVPKVGWKVVRVGSSGGSGSVSVEKGWTDWLLNVSAPSDDSGRC